MSGENHHENEQIWRMVADKRWPVTLIHKVVVVAAVLVGAEVVVAAVFVGARVVAAVVVGTGLATVFACVTAGAGADDVAAVVAGAGAGGVDIDIDTGLGAIDTDTYDKRTVSCFLVVFDSIIASFSMDDGVARGDVFSSTEPVSPFAMYPPF
ncbi:hypothetical protein MUCCIDRAFT_164495 [Mucor lusitanicus CBS 277.49]|uniref:Uncharacterized protein n=1 Tax=Mucor lusitanicus CBS 277.49 TaxID=747725 RepID=A0A162QYL2_MUCCL|nr:hypothetical protein MUCCIDRAFT_164495 [Mucor lusitanicus CBS 277.49]